MSTRSCVSFLDTKKPAQSGRFFFAPGDIRRGKESLSRPIKRTYSAEVTSLSRAISCIIADCALGRRSVIILHRTVCVKLFLRKISAFFFLFSAVPTGYNPLCPKAFPATTAPTSPAVCRRLSRPFRHEKEQRPQPKPGALRNVPDVHRDPGSGHRDVSWNLRGHRAGPNPLKKAHIVKDWDQSFTSSKLENSLLAEN